MLELRRELEPELDPTAFLSLPYIFFMVETASTKTPKRSKGNKDQENIFVSFLNIGANTNIKLKRAREQELWSERNERRE